MKRNKKISVKEVKRAFVIAQLVRLRKGKKRYLGSVSQKEFKQNLTKVKKQVLKMKEPQLDRMIGNDYKKRLHAYNNSVWYLGKVQRNEVGVWRGAGGLPRAWTKGSLKETSKKVAHALEHNPSLIKKRARHTIENILRTNVKQLQKEKYLFPIIFESGTGTNGRRGLKKLKGDIDDGNMRSIALTIKGTKTIQAYIGLQK
ncbi:MAG: hypothetical protein G01um101456_602 [Parcubacteria group bacterium Gr01-1014_56]|nr:MAG: hypothetical protein G01um101456_602 [Parcubacteria group bacterium Gr01-1014_56]